MSSGNFGSAISVTAELRMRRDQILSDIDAAGPEIRSRLQSMFQGVDIPIGARIVESVSAAAPQITEIIAAAIAALEVTDASA